MLGLEDWMDILHLHKQGHSIRQICRISGVSRNTVRKVLRNGSPPKKKRKKRKSILDEFKPYLKKRYLETGLSAVRLLEEIKPMGYPGKVDVVRRFLKIIDQEFQLSNKATVRFETPPGEQAQVDWAEVGSFIDKQGKRRKVYAFVMVLGFSRMLFVEFTLSMKLEVLIKCHQNAFEYFGGWTRSILYDNMAQVRLPSGKLNPLMLDFLSHYGIKPKTHRPYRPRTKGKVERSVLYLKDNFIKAREFSDLPDLQAQGFHWQENVANQRVHSTTKRKPCEMFLDEDLIPLSSIEQYRLCRTVERTVNAEGFVLLDGNRYSVPPEKVGQKVFVEQGEQRIFIRTGDLIIAEHNLAQGSNKCIVKEEHIQAMWKMTVEKQKVPPLKKDKTLFQEVQQRPLIAYEEVIG